MTLERMLIQPVVLQGMTILLRPLQQTDLDSLSRIAFDPELWENTSNRLVSPQDLDEYVAAALALAQAGTALPFVTIHRPTATVVGSTRFANIDRQHRRAEIGWTWLTRQWQRSSVNTEAKYLMLRHAFEVWGCQRVELKTATFNERSRRAIERIGAIQEGILRKHMLLPDGRIRDTVYYSIIDDEWEGVKRELEQKLGLT